MHTQQFLKIAVLPVILSSVLMMGGCVSLNRPESTITGFQKVSSFENKKVSLSLPVVVEKNMETKKNPDATEKAVANEVYTELKNNLVHNGIFSTVQGRDINSVELRVHYIDEYFGAYKYFGVISDRGVGGQIVMTRVIFKKNDGTVITQIDSLHNTASYISRKPMVQEISAELANQIEKILKEGVNVGKSP